MKITVTTLTELTFQLEVPDDLELENFKAFCEIESGIPGEFVYNNVNEEKCNFIDDICILRELYSLVHRPRRTRRSMKSRLFVIAQTNTFY